MSSEDFELLKRLKDARKEIRAKYGVACPECVSKLPRANPSILLPGQICRIHKYVDPRERIAYTETDAIFKSHGLERKT